MSDNVAEILIKAKNLTQDELREVRTGLKDLADTTDNTANRLKEAEKKIRDVGGALRDMGSTLSIAITAPIVGAAAAALKAAVSYESAFAGVRKTVNATEPEFAKLNEGFRKMALQMPVTANELARVGEAAGQLGIKNEAILGFTEVMAKLGATTNLSADQAADSLARLANITKMPKDEFDRLGSTIVALGNEFESTEAEIVSMGVRIAGVGNQVGLAEHQIMAIATALSSVGIEAEAGGSAISKVLVDIASAVSKGGDKLALFAKVSGESVAAFKKHFKDDAAGALDAFIRGLARVKESGGNVLGTLEKLGFEEIRQRMALLNLAGATDKLTQALATGKKAWDENTALNKEFGERSKTTESQLLKLKSEINDVGISMGNALLPAFRDAVAGLKTMVPYLKDAVQHFSDMSPMAKDASITIAGAFALTGPAMLAVGGLASALENVIKLYRTLAATAVATKLGGLAAALPAGAAAAGAAAVGAAGLVVLNEYEKAMQNYLRLEEEAAAKQNERVLKLKQDRELIARLNKSFREEQEAEEKKHVAAVVKITAELTDEQKKELAKYAKWKREQLSKEEQEYGQYIEKQMKADAEFKKWKREQLSKETQAVREELEKQLKAIKEHKDWIRDQEAREQEEAKQRIEREIRDARRALEEKRRMRQEMLGNLADAFDNVGLPALAKIVDAYAAGAAAGDKFRDSTNGAAKAMLALSAASKAYASSKWEGAAQGAAFGAQASGGNPYAIAGGAILGFALGWIGESKRAREELAKLRAEFFESRGGLTELRREAAAAGLSLDRLFNAKNAKELTAEIERLRSALDLKKKAWDDLNEAVERYGFSIEELGPKWQQQKLNEMALQLLKDYELLIGAGAENDVVLTRMADSFNKLAQNAKKTGAAIPEALRGPMQRLLEMGLLTDEAGNKLESLDGINFSDTEGGIKDLIDAIYDLIEALTGIPRKIPINIHTTYTSSTEPPPEPPPNTPPPLAHGGIIAPHGWQLPHAADGMLVSRPGAGVPIIAGERGPEVVAPVDALFRRVAEYTAALVERMGGGGGNTIVIQGYNRDPRELAQMVAAAISNNVAGAGTAARIAATGRP